MKKIASIFVGLVMVFLCATCISAKGSSDDKVSETRSVSAFHSIELESVASVYFTQSDTYSLRVEGEKKWVNQTKCTVKDGVFVDYVGGKREEDHQERERTLHLYQCPRFAESYF